MAVSVEKKLYKLLSKDGSGNGPLANVDFSTVDGSTTPVPMYIQPPVGEKWLIQRLIIAYKDGNGFKADNFGTQAALTNGLLMQVLSGDSEVILDLNGTPEFATTTNAGWTFSTGNAELRTWGNGSEFIVAIWDFTADDSGGADENDEAGILLDGSKLHRLQCLVQDNLSTMAGPFGMSARGRKL